MDLNDVLLESAEEGNLLVLKAAIEKGANINTEDKYGKTALMIASEKGHTDIVEYLKEKGAKEKKDEEASNFQDKDSILKEETIDIKELLEGAAKKLGCKLDVLSDTYRLFSMIVPVENNRTQYVLATVVKDNMYIRFISFYSRAVTLTLDVATILLKDNLFLTGITNAIVDFDWQDGQGAVPSLAIVGEQLITTADLDEVVDKIKNVAEQADNYENIIFEGRDDF